MDPEQLNTKLAEFPYVGGYQPTQADVAALEKVGDKPNKNLVHLNRWFNHMKSFTPAEKKKFVAAPEPAKKAGGDDDDDDSDVDLFGSDDEEAEKAKAERAKALEDKKKGAKPGVIAKSSIVIDVKVWDDTTDLNEVEKSVRSIQKDGLLWGASKQVPLAFGINKLQMGCVVEDEKISVDWLTETIEEFDLVQSTDIAAFQKI